MAYWLKKGERMLKRNRTYRQDELQPDPEPATDAVCTGGRTTVSRSGALRLATGFLLSLALVACSDDDTDGGRNNGDTPSEDASTPDASGDGGAELITEGFAINEDFDSWEDNGGRDFFVSKGDPEPYDDHNTVKNIDG